MSKITVVSQDCDNIKKGLQELINKEVTITVKEKTKVFTNKAVIKFVSDKLFCLDVKVDKKYTRSCSYTFLDLKTSKVKIKEAPYLNDEIPQTY